MEMSEALKKYAPWIVGGVAGLWLISRFTGGSQSSGAATVAQPSAAYYQAAAAASAAQASAQTQQQANQMQYDLASKTLDAQTAQAAVAGQTAYISALGDLANKVGAAASNLITAQSLLPLQAIKTVGDQNQAALIGAATVGAATAKAAGQIGSGLAQSTGNFVSSANYAATGALNSATQITQSNNQAATQGNGNTGQAIGAGLMMAAMLM